MSVGPIKPFINAYIFVLMAFKGGFYEVYFSYFRNPERDESGEWSVRQRLSALRNL